jgi:hypothetical protein
LRGGPARESSEREGVFADGGTGLDLAALGAIDREARERGDIRTAMNDDDDDEDEETTSSSSSSGGASNGLRDGRFARFLRRRLGRPPPPPPA